jgi:hypothetical protein
MNYPAPWPHLLERGEEVRTGGLAWETSNCHLINLLGSSAGSGKIPFQEEPVSLQDVNELTS